MSEDSYTNNRSAPLETLNAVVYIHRYFTFVNNQIIWVWNLVAHIEGGTQAEGVWE